MSNTADQRWNIFVGAAVAVLCSFSGWLALEIIELKRQVVLVETRQIHNREAVEKLIDVLVLPRLQDEKPGK